MTIISDGQLDKVLISQSVKFKDGLELHMVAGGVILCRADQVEQDCVRTVVTNAGKLFHHSTSLVSLY